MKDEEKIMTRNKLLRRITAVGLSAICTMSMFMNAYAAYTVVPAGEYGTLRAMII